MWMLLAHAHAQTPLDFDEAMREASLQAPDVALAAATADVQLGAVQARYALLDNPRLEVARVGDETELRAGLAVPLAGQPITRARAASAGRDAVERSAGVARLDALVDVGLAWLAARRAVDVDALQQGTLELARRSRHAARELLQAGEIGTVDAAVAEATAARAEVDASFAHQEAVRQAVLLEARLGRAPSDGLVLGEWPALAPPTGRDPAALPRVVAAERESDRARAAATLAAQERVPTPTVSGGWIDGPDQAGPIVGVELELPLFAPGTGELRAARGERAFAEAEVRRTRLAAEAEWTIATRELEAAEAAEVASRVEGLDRALEDLASAWAAGEYSLTDYVARRDAVIAALEARIDARYRRAVASLHLWGLAGALPDRGTP